MLTIMGRVQLINAVISSMLVYSFHIYCWPVGLLSVLAKLMKNFIWSRDYSKKKICTVAWKFLCKHREEGGLSIKNPATVNKASLMHLSWKLLTSNEQWAQLCRARYLRKGKPVNYHLSSSVWHGMKSHVMTLYHHPTWTIGNGQNIHFWTDTWLDKTIVEILNIHDSLHHELDMYASDYIVDNAWSIPDYFSVRNQSLVEKIQQITLPLVCIADKLNWNDAVDGCMTNKHAFNFIAGNNPKPPLANLIWNRFIPPTRSFVVWRLLHNKLPTDDNLRKRGCVFFC